MVESASDILTQRNTGTPLEARPLRLSAIMAPQANNFGLIRAAMALAVLVSHAYYLTTGMAAAEPLVAWTGHSLGEHAVQVFFFLSGILVAQSLDNSRGLIDFAAARALRIFPGLIVCVLLTALVLGPAVSRLAVADAISDGETLSYIWRTLSLQTGLATLPGVFDHTPAAGVVNMSVWTLKYEVMCYAGLAMAALMGLMKPHMRMRASLLLATFVALVFIAEPKSPDTYGFLDNVRYFALFFATGVLAYLLRDVLVLSWSLLALLALIFLAALGTRFGELATALFLGYAALMAAKLPAGRLRGLANRYDLSYGIYIYACPVQQLLIERVPGAGVEAQVVLASLSVLPLALASWIMVEQPALRQRRRLVDVLQALLPTPARPALGDARRAR